MEDLSRLNQLRIIKSGPKVESIVLPAIVAILTRKQNRTQTKGIESVLAHAFRKQDRTFQFELGQRRENARRMDNDCFEHWIGLINRVNTLFPSSFCVKARITCYRWLPTFCLSTPCSPNITMTAHIATLHEFLKYAAHVHKHNLTADVAPADALQSAEQHAQWKEWLAIYETHASTITKVQYSTCRKPPTFQIST